MADSILTLATTPDGDELWLHGCGTVEAFTPGTGPVAYGLCPCQDDTQGWRRLATLGAPDRTATFAAAILAAPNGGAGTSAHQVLAQRIEGNARAASAADRAIAAEVRDRARVGMAKYGQTLQAFDGRSTWVDAWQEALDLAAYVAKWFMERPTSGVEWLHLAVQQLLRDLWNLRDDGYRLDPATFPQAPRADLPGDAQ